MRRRGGDEREHAEHEIGDDELAHALGRRAGEPPFAAAHVRPQARLQREHDVRVHDDHDHADADHRVHAGGRRAQPAVGREKADAAAHEHHDGGAHERQEARQHAFHHRQPLGRLQRREAGPQDQDGEGHAAHPQHGSAKVQREQEAHDGPGQRSRSSIVASAAARLTRLGRPA
jgi:hypothetical protein